MAPVLPNEVPVVTDNPSVVNLIPAMLTCLNGLPSVKASCPGIRVFCDGGVIIERLGKSLGAFLILHTGGLFVLSTTGAMNHKLPNEVKQLRIVQRKLRRHKAVNLLRRTQLGMGFEKDNDVSMRKAPLLKLNGVKVAIDIPKHTILNVTNEGKKLGMKDTYN